jgi:hypothetical protein
MHARIVILLISCLFIISCDDSETINTESMDLLSYKTPCQGITQLLCLVTHDSDNDVNSFFYDSIEEFNFVWGHTYQLSVKITEISNPPADGSSLKYELKEIISDIEDNIETSYNYELVELLDFTLTMESNVYYFLGQPFECKVDVDCDSLVNLNNSGGLINVYFEYIGEGKIMLVEWN